jgi:hypothetical protein
MFCFLAMVLSKRSVPVDSWLSDGLTLFVSPLPLAPAHLLKLATRFILGFIVRPIPHDRLLSYLLLFEDLPVVGSPCLHSCPLSTLLCFNFWEWSAACLALNFNLHWVCTLCSAS